jgi:hypothetical protein
MEWLAISTLAVIVIGITLRRSRQRIRPGSPVEVIFELRLPSEWAAELTARTLRGDGLSEVDCESRDPLSCRVSQRLPYEGREIERLCGRFDRIAAGRGGGCARHVVQAGARRFVFEH